MTRVKTVPNVADANTRTSDSRGSGFHALYRKELTDHIHSVRLKLVFALLLLTGLAGIYGALTTLKASEDAPTSYLYLSILTTSGGSMLSFASFMAYLAPLAGLALGFDAITRENAQGTLNRLVSQPIYRDTVIIAKTLAGTAVVFLMTYGIGILCGAVILIATGIPPKSEETVRIFSYLTYTACYISLWMGLSVLCSVLCKHAATSALIIIALWIVLTMFGTMIASAVANLLYPTQGIQGYGNLYANYRTQITMDRCSPYYLYCEAISILLNPNIRTVGLVTQEALSGAVAGYLSFEQSVMLIWPHLTVMVVLMLGAFLISYVAFMRKEIRA